MDLIAIKDRVKNSSSGVLKSRRVQVALVSFFVLSVIAYFAYPFITGTEATPYLIGRVTYPAATSPYAITAADFDGVNGVDTAVLSDAGTPDTLSVFLKNGTSTFGTRTDYSLGGSITGNSICSANFDNANGVDIAVANESNDILIFYNDGSGGFSGTPTTVNVGTGSSLIHCDDLNGDGRADLSVRSGSSIVVITNNNYSGFNAASTYTSGYNVYSFAVGDLNYDGFVDLATGTSVLYTTSNVVVFRNNNNAGFLGADTVYTATYTACSTWCTNTAVSALKIADLNGDGKNDLLYSPQGVELTFKNIAIAPNTTSSSGGVVSFSPFIEENIIYGNTESIKDIYPYDFDGDGDKDIVAVGAPTNGVTFYLENVGSFGFYGPEAFTGAGNAWGTPPVNYDYTVSNPGGPVEIVVADFDLDGDADIASPNTGSNELSVLYLTTVPTLTTISPTIVAKNDVLTLTTNGTRFTGNGVSTIKMSGTNLATTYVTEQQLTTPLTITQTGTIGTYPITVFNGAPGGGESSSISLTIVPAVYFSAPTDSANEGTATQKDFTISLSDAIGNDVVVNYTLSGTADNSTDYTAASLSGTATILAGNTSVIVPFPLNDDLADEVDETIIMTLDSVVGTDATIRTIQNIQTFTILDDDPPPTLSFTSTTFSGSEGDYAYVGFQVDQYSGKTITAQISIADVTTTGADYSNVTNFVITPGVSSGNFTISLNSDAAYDPNETFTVTIDSADWALLGSPLVSTVTITENHPSPYANTQNINENNAPGSQTQEVTVLLPTAFAAGSTTVDVNVVTGGSAILGTDYTFSGPQTVTFPANTTTATFNVTTINDSTSGDTNITFGFSNCSCDSLSADFTVNIIDTNPVPYDPGFNTVYENSSPQAQAVTIYLNTSFPANLSFDVNVTGGTAVSGVDFVAFSTATVTIPANTYIGTFNVTTISDATYDAPRTILFTMSNCVNCNLTTPSISVSLIDNNAAAYLASPTLSVVEGNTQSSNGFYIEPSSANVETVSFSIDPASTATYGDDYTIDTTGSVAYNSGTNVGTVTFQIGETFIGLSIISVADAVADPNETVIINLGTYSGGQIGQTSTSTYTIQEPEVSFPITSSSNLESVTSTNFAVDLNTTFPTTSTVTFSLSGTATYSTDYTVSNTGFVSYDSNTNTGTITYYSYYQTVPIYLSIVNNAIAEPNETVIVTLNSFDQGAVGTNSTYTYTINNDDANRIGFSSSSASGAESVSLYNATVQLDIADNTQNTTFNLIISGTATNGSEYSVSTGPYTITQGNTSTTVPVTIYNDAVDEPNETVVMTLTNISGNVVGGTVAQTYTITDDDAPYAKIFLDSGFITEADTNTNKINIGDTIYLKVNDARFNTSIGSINTISTSNASVVSDGGDTEGVTLTETSADSNIFTGSITTISGTIAVDGILQIQGADTVNLVINSSGSTTIDDFSTYSSTSTNPGALTSSSNGLAGYWASAGGTSTLQNNAGDQYIRSISSAGNMYVVRNKSTAAAAGYNFSDTNLAFDISISNSGYSTASWTLSTQTFTGLNILLVDNASCYYYQQVTTPISSNSASPTSVSIARTGFTQSSIGAACSFNFSDVRSTFFIVPSTIVNTVTIDNLNQNSLINYSSPDALVVGGPTAVTLNAATNITTSSMDLSWSQNVDVDFANYKVYYSTTSPVSLASTVATTITNNATTTHSLTGLDPSTQYYIRVLVTNATGGKTWSNEINATTAAPACSGNGVICIMDSNTFENAPASIVVGASLYFQLNSSSLNANSGVAETVSITVTSTLNGDSESRTLTESNVNTGIFYSGSTVGTGATQSLATSSSNSSGVMQTSNGDTITASLGSNGGTLIDDASSCAAFSGAGGNSVDCTGGIATISRGSDLQGIAVIRSGAINFGSDGLTFTLNASGMWTGSYDVGGPLINYPAIAVGDGTNVAIVDISSQITSFNQNHTITITQTPSQPNSWVGFGGGPLPNFNAIGFIYFIYPETSVNPVTLEIDNISTYNSSSISDSVSVTGPVSPTAVTLAAATNVTTTSLDLSWSQNADGDFANYKIYYATHPTVTTADTLATTITTQATTTYSLTGLTSGTTYYIRVLVTNTALDTAFSNERSVATNGAAGVTVTATIPPLISYSLSPSYCNLGALTDTTISVCNFDISVSTNASAGYVAYIESQNNGVLTDGSKQIGAASSSTISAGTAGWGIGTSESGLGGAGEIPTTSTCTSSNSPTLKGLTTTPYTVARFTAPADTRVTNVCVGAAISSTTPAGSYTDIVTITIVGNF